MPSRSTDLAQPILPRSLHQRCDLFIKCPAYHDGLVNRHRIVPQPSQSHCHKIVRALLLGVLNSLAAATTGNDQGFVVLLLIVALLHFPFLPIIFLLFAIAAFLVV